MYCVLCGKKCGYPPRCHTCYMKYGASFFEKTLPPNLENKSCVLCGRPAGVSEKCYSCYVKFRLYEEQPTEIKPLVKLDDTPFFEEKFNNEFEEDDEDFDEGDEDFDEDDEDFDEDDEDFDKNNKDEYKGYIPSNTTYAGAIYPYSNTTYSGGKYTCKKTKYSYAKLEDNEPKNEVRETEYDEDSELFKEAMEAYNNLKKRKVVRGYTNYCKTCGKPSGRYEYCRICHEGFTHRPFITKNGYRMIFSPEHSTRKDGYAYEHRVNAEILLKRKLRKNEVVHHINGDKLDNRYENLTVLDRNDHNELHDLYFY